MTQPPQNPGPGEQPWQAPQGGPATPPGSPPAHGADYGSQGGGLPSYPGDAGAGASAYSDPAQGLAGKGARLGAAVLDTLLLAVVVYLVTLPFVDVSDMEPSAQWTVSGVSAVLSFLYFWGTQARSGQSLGKKALGIRVVRDSDRGPISVGQAAGRAAFYNILGGITGCVALIDNLWLLWDDRRQTLHDKVAHTVVIKSEPGDPNPYTKS